MKLALVFVGAGLGGCLRYAVNIGTARLWGLSFPWGTVTVNVVGSFLMGALTAWLAYRDGHALSEHARLFLATGILGGFTTFSAFSLDAVALWERGDAGLALAYVALSVLVSIGAVIAGLAAMRWIGG
nr:fluoride efflux transporter CrcB [Microvirga antarctica]